MTGGADAFQTTWAELREMDSAAAVMGLLDEVDEREQAGELTRGAADHLRDRAFASLQALTTDDPVGGAQLIINRLLPLCLTRTPDEPREEGHPRPSFRQRLAEWLGQYPADARAAPIDRVLDAVRERLQDAAADPRSACWTTAALGFRRSDVVAALWEVVRREEGHGGDAALSTLTRLGILPDERPALLDAVHRRVERRFAIELFGALDRLADPASLEVVRHHWLRPEAWHHPLDQGLVALQVLTSIADTAPETSSVQDRVWEIIARLADEAPDEVGPSLLISGAIAPRCDSPAVVPSLIRLLERKGGQTDAAAHGRYLVSERLGACMRPRQLAGWNGLSAPSALAILRADSGRDTGPESLYQTMEMLRKEAAWDMLLLWGEAADPALFAAAVEGETNRYVRARICEQLACFRFDPLPGFILQLVTERYDHSEGSLDAELLARLAAVKTARSAASLQAFAALRRFGLTLRGQVLQESVDALVMVAAWLAGMGHVEVIEAVVDDVARAPEAHQRLAAAGAVERLAAMGWLRPEHLPRLLPSALDEGRDSFERGRLVRTMTYFSTDQIPREIVQRLPTWASGTDELGLQALGALADHGLLLDYPSLLDKRLGIRRQGETWQRRQDASGDVAAAFAIGLLYRHQPQALAPAVAAIVRDGNWDAAYQILLVLRHGNEGTGQQISPLIVDALLERMRQRMGYGVAEPELFDAVARLAPNSLGREPWTERWAGWRPETRAALADALGVAAMSEASAAEQAASLLLTLTRDEQYGVRRSAYRALARRAPRSLQAISLMWAASDEVPLRERAAEAWAWLPVEDSGMEVITSLRDRLSVDAEPTVRDSAERAWRERREREWAWHGLVQVRAVIARSPDAVVSGYRYGQAVVHWGDDACLDELEEMIRPKVAPNLHHWLVRLARGVRERWRKVTQDWPDPWLSWEGALEEVEGTAQLPDGREVAVRFALWSKPGVLPTGKSSWGGAAWVGPPDHLLFSGGEMTMLLKDGRRASGAVEFSNGSLMMFVGTGSYPS